MMLAFPNSAWVTTREHLILAGGTRAKIRLQVRYGVVVHPVHGPILIDTGYTEHALLGRQRSAALRLYSRLIGPQMIPSGQPAAVLARLGFTPSDVKTVIVTHFHADHMSGLRLFPNARFVVDGPAWAHVQTGGWTNLRHGVFTELLPDGFATRITPLDGGPDGTDILHDGSLVAVPLPGHAKGHFGVLINLTPAPVLYAVDAQWLAQAARDDRTPNYPARLIADDYAALKHSSAVVAGHLAAGREVVFCHDPDPTPYDLP